MTKGKTTLIQKDLQKGTIPSNYRLITCLPLMWKILTVQIREEIYYSLLCCRLFPKEQKGYHKGTRRTDDLQYIDQHILKESEARQKNVAMAWNEFRKVPYFFRVHLISSQTVDSPQTIFKFIMVSMSLSPTNLKC